MLQISFITMSGPDNIRDRITYGLLHTSNSLLNLFKRRLAESFRGIAIFHLMYLELIKKFRHDIFIVIIQIKMISFPLYASRKEKIQINA